MTTFTIEELNGLLNLLDLAVKAGGIPVAEQAIPLVGKMRQMAQEMQAPAETNEGHA